MKFKILIVFALFYSLLSFSQQQRLIYKSNGNIYNEQNEKFTPNEIRELLKSKPILLEEYNSGRDKKSFGNFFLITGSALVVGDLARGFLSDSYYSGTLTYVGAAMLIIAIPIKIGYEKKIKGAVREYNKQIAMNDSFNIERMTLVANRNGVGLQITF